MQFTFGTNPSVICKTCDTNPVATLNGRQVDECALCYARTVRVLSEWYGDYWLNGKADDLDAAIEQQLASPEVAQ